MASRDKSIKWHPEKILMHRTWLNEKGNPCVVGYGGGVVAVCIDEKSAAQIVDDHNEVLHLKKINKKMASLLGEMTAVLSNAEHPAGLKKEKIAILAADKINKKDARVNFEKQIKNSHRNNQQEKTMTNTFLIAALTPHLNAAALEALDTPRALASWYDSIDSDGALEIARRHSATGSPFVIRFTALNQAAIDEARAKLEAARAAGNEELSDEISDNFPAAVWGA